MQQTATITGHGALFCPEGGTDRENAHTTKPPATVAILAVLPTEISSIHWFKMAFLIHPDLRAPATVLRFPRQFREHRGLRPVLAPLVTTSDRVEGTPS